jgi:hypothetical protein
MQQPIAMRTDAEDVEEVTRRDIRAMIAMIDYLVTQVRPIDGVAAHCLVLARKSLESGVAPDVVPLH